MQTIPKPNSVPNIVDSSKRVELCQHSSEQRWYYVSEDRSVSLVYVTEDEHIQRIRHARQALSRVLSTAAEHELALADEIRAAYKDGLKTGPISRAAEWSDTYVRSIREGKVLRRDVG